MMSKMKYEPEFIILFMLIVHTKLLKQNKNWIWVTQINPGKNLINRNELVHAANLRTLDLS